jgi:hypothetical protein
MMSIWIILKKRTLRNVICGRRQGGKLEMTEIKYLVWIWKRSFLGFYYKAPVVRTAHTDMQTARRLGRRFTIEDLMRPNHSMQTDINLKEATA